MKSNKLLLVICSVCLSGSALSQESGFYLGADFGAGRLSLDDEVLLEV